MRTNDNNIVVEAVNAAVIRQEELELKKENTPKNPTLDSNAFGNLVTANKKEPDNSNHNGNSIY